jgi:predicted acylesterase/phospholipase RssA
VQYNTHVTFSIVFGGGGCRTFWGMGVLDSLGWPPPTEWAGASAGSAMCLIASTGRTDATLRRFVEATRLNRKNMYPVNAVLPFRKVFPHEEIYRDVLAHALDGPGWQSLRQASPVHTFLAYVRPGEPVARSVLGAVRSYQRRSRQNILHGASTLPRGIETETVTLQTLQSPQRVVDTVISSSATWPVTGLPRVAGRTYIDSAAVDGLPVRALSPSARRGKILIFLSNTVDPAKLPSNPNRMYLAPEVEPAISMWDYANPEKVLETFERGQREGRRLRSRIQDFIG